MQGFWMRRFVPMRRFCLTTVGAALLAMSGDGLATELRLPSGPGGPGRFGAYYTTLQYDDAWDQPWRVGPHADVVVRFATGGHKFVFWRGTSYIPCWVTDTDVWYTNEFVERAGGQSPNTSGCCEPMSDKQCRYSHVRIIENTEARVVIHWRYAPVDVHYNHPFIDPETGWSDWVDEYYTLYPDSTCVRKITAHTSRPDLWMEWHEAIVINPPGTRPEDHIERDAVSVANMKGQTATYTWTAAGGPEFGDPADANLLRINLKAERVPFAIVPPGPAAGRRAITVYPGHGLGSFFNFWDHWPVSQLPSDVNLATSTSNPSHTSLCHMGKQDDAWAYYERGENRVTKVMLNGMTDKEVGGLVPLAKSWINAPAMELLGTGCEHIGFDQADRAYHLAMTGPMAPREAGLRLLANEEQPVINPALVIKDWGEGDAFLKLDGVKVERGPDFRFGHRHTLEGVDLIVWINRESTQPVEIVLYAPPASTATSVVVPE
jgi:hypothetical protein